ncbi:MAG: transposase [Dysgonamonadaceae bacterium]|jgi:REP element-mobilizing transposase RayT|nr:transposase [Dysgonamonadaceae bacterium]
MPFNPDIHHRRSIRLRDYDYSQAGLYFVTICVQKHECMFGKITDGEMILNEYGKTANDCWLDIPQHYPNVVLHEFVVMPNHVHGIIEIITNDDGTGVGAKNFSPCNNNSPNNNELPMDKRANDDEWANDKGANNYSPLRRQPCGTSRTIGAIVRGFKIGVTKQIGYSVWQRNYFEHIIQNEKRHWIIVDYINNNPARWETDMFYKV